MRRTTRVMAAVLLAAMLSLTVASAYEYSGTIQPGETYGFAKSEFFDSRGNSILSEVKLDSSNFVIHRKTITKGANLIKEIKINARSQEVQIIFADDVVTAVPNRPNVTIGELSVRAKRTVRQDGTVLLNNDTIYKLDVPYHFYVGLTTNGWEMDNDGVEINLEDGDRKYVTWSGGDGNGKVRVSYGSLAYLEGRVYDGERVLYSFSNDVDDRIENANPSAYITSVDMGNAQFTASMNLQLIANKEDYIYEFSDGKLTAATGLKWSEDDYAWVGKIKTGKCYVVSDVKLRAPSGNIANGTTGGGSGSSSTSGGNSNNNYNPETGGGSNVAVSISAIVAIVAIAIVSIIMSTIVTVKKNKSHNKREAAV